MFYNTEEEDMSSMGNVCANGGSSLSKIIIDGNKVL